MTGSQSIVVLATPVGRALIGIESSIGRHRGRDPCRPADAPLPSSRCFPDERLPGLAGRAALQETARLFH